MFNLFKKKKSPRVFLKTTVIIEYLQNCIDIDAPVAFLEIKSNNITYKLGITSDYNKNQGFFDILFYLDDQEFETLQDFKDGATIQMTKFVDFKDDVEVLSSDGMEPTNVLMFTPYAVESED